MGNVRAWSLIALQSEKRQYGGNTGYVDDWVRIYRYDSSVPNHRQLDRGDLVFIRDTDTLLGVACVDKILAFPSEKLRQRCPVCGSTGLKVRRSKAVPWRCAKGHEFDSPVQFVNSVTAYEAHYGGSFVGVPAVLPVAVLKAAAFRPNDQLSIEELDLARIERTLTNQFPETTGLIYGFLQGRTLTPSDAGEEQTEARVAFEGSMTDTREQVLRSIRVRRGQKNFRDRLIQRYGAKCMASGTETMDVVEAAHIDPFRGESDHHPDNGLLLRADLHTLFDLNLMSVDPYTLELHFHPDILDGFYREIQGRVLRIEGDARPAQAPLQRRWIAFLRIRGLPR